MKTFYIYERQSVRFPPIGDVALSAQGAVH